MNPEHIHFVTGRLAENALRRTLARLADQAGFAYSIQVMPISVAALMTPHWIARRLQVPVEATAVLLPGYCQGELETLEQQLAVPVARGPRDLRELPEYFGRESSAEGYGEHSIEILAEINHAPRLSLDDVLRQARRLAADGADVIDVGCEPGYSWPDVDVCVRALRDEGLRVSIDSFDGAEIERAVRAGAELVLSVNQSNREAACDWGCEVVAIPDQFESLGGLDQTLELLDKHAVPSRIDPILEPIGVGFAPSLGRYLDVRRRYPNAPMLMGIGNLTELTDADSGPLNVLLLGFCQELRIGSVLTTQVIPWAQSSVRECQRARRLVHYAVEHRVVPKHLEPDLVMLRDPRVIEPTVEELEELSRTIKDPNYRLFLVGGVIHLVAAGLHLQHRDPFRLFDELAHSGPGGARPANLDPAHAFYLGYEMAKAATARTLGKQYRQDEALRWGLLTEREAPHRLSFSPSSGRPKRQER